MSIILLLFFVFFFMHKVKSSYLNVLPLFYCFIPLYSKVVETFFPIYKSVAFGFDLLATESSKEKVVIMYILASFSFFIGAGFYSSKSISLKLQFEFLKKYLSMLPSFIIIILIFLNLLFLHLGAGGDYLYYRVGYAGSTGYWGFRVLFALTLPIGSLCIPYVKNKYQRWLLFFALIFFVQGTCSRSLALIPLMYLVGLFIRDFKVSGFKFIALIVLTTLFLAFSVQFRDNQYQGIIPNIEFLFTNGIDFGYILPSLNYVFSFSYYSSAVALSDFVFNKGSFYQAISPLPSSMINVEQMMESQILNDAAPIPAIAYLFLGGYFLLFTYYFISGFIWSWCSQRIMINSKVLCFVVFILFIIYTLLSVQYNLRSISRLTYYVISICLVVWFNRFLRNIVN